MSLRARMGIAAGVAVALAVVAVSASAYLGTRSELNAQIDSSLRSLSMSVIGPAAGGGGFSFLGGAPGTGTETGPGTGTGTNASRKGAASGAVGYLFGGGTSPFGPNSTSGDSDDAFPLSRDRAVPAFGGAAGTLTQIKPDGTSRVPSRQGYRIPVTAQIKAIAKRGVGTYETDMHVGKNHIRVLVTGIGAFGALAVALPLTSVDNTLSHELLLMLVIAAAGIAFAGLLGFLVARTAVAPIAQFTRQAERIATNPERVERERLEVTGDDELARLAGTFNTTLDALEASIVSQRNLVADASHELRTPIATLRANLQLMRDEDRLPQEDRDALRSDMIEELDELTRLVGDVVELARGSKAGAGVGDLRLDQITGEALERARRRAPQLRFQTELEPTLVRGEGERIARAITNLLDNASKWSPAGEVVEVTLADGTLSVRDRGPGFHEEDLPFVFDRFHRARDARSKPGSGLGLAIVRQAAEAHGGFVKAGNAPGGGALMTIGFGPALDPPEEPPGDLPTETPQSAHVVHE